MPTQDISPIDTIVELTALLADRYRVERELGRGGMATVYLAHDLKHDRPVALKVMHLEIAAGLGVERFVREVRLTARLQHPHILPVFDSGTVAGRPWYSMPYVPGESLRDRLRREVQLPVDTAVEIARQVALALEAAHRQGAVHRDVKPENILLCDGQALIADFGIARAIDSAGEERITSSGLAVGTPAYMAPEQAGGGPIDGRADVYALGCVLYEMLAGEPPVTGATPQAIIAKRLAQPPPSLLVVRPSVPKPVDQAVRKALALVPADRFAGAAQLAEALVLKPARASARSAAWGMLGLGVAILIAGAYLLHRARPPSPPTLLSAGVLRARDPLLIADFESPAGDSVLGPTVTEAFRIDLTGSPVVTVMTAPMVDSALMRMRRPVSARLDGALAREVALREGVKAVVTGQVARVMGSYLVSAEVIAVASGEVLAAHRETAADSTRLIDAIDRLSGRLRERIGESLRSVREEPRLERVTTGSLEALWKFTKAIHVGDFESDYVRAVALLQEAVALDTGFATAYRTLGTYQGFLGDREGEVAALTRAVRHRDRLTESEREHTRALYHALVTGRLDQSVAAYRALLERRPADTAARNNLGAFYNALHQPARAESILRAGLDTVRPWGPGIHVNLAYSLVALGRRPEAERMLEQGARLFPGNRAFAWYRVRLATSRGDYSAAASNARAFLDRYGETPAERIAPLRELAGIALVRGRLTEAEQRFGEAMAAAAEARSYAAYLEAAAALGYLHVWFRRDPARGLETVAAALARYPLDSIAVLQRPYLTLAFLYASAGQPQRARALLGMYQRGVDPELRRIHEPRLRWTWGQVALAEGRFADAIREFRAYLPSPRDCLPCGHATLARAYDGAGNADSALALYERYLALPSADRLNESHLFEDDATQLAPACKRLGELYEQRGERDKATKYYRRFVALWQEADPELRPAVGEITQRLRQ